MKNSKLCMVTFIKDIQESFTKRFNKFIQIYLKF